MLASVDQLSAGCEYNLPSEFANLLIWKGKASAVEAAMARVLPTFEIQQAGPSEMKPVEPQETKPRKKAKRA
jgi:hypothetical protein